MFRELDAGRIVRTLEQLHQRIGNRFPGSGLAQVGAELTDVARQTDQRARDIRKSDWPLRGLVGALLIFGLVLLLMLAYLVLAGKRPEGDLYGTLEGIDSGFNIVVLMGASLFFLVSLEDRRKRKRALTALQEVRSIIHVIDMHQLTKDPSTDVAGAEPGKASEQLDPRQMMHYLDYCSEMLSLAAKVAALYAQSYPDAVVTEAVSDLERTVTGLSQKIWQKINIIHGDLNARRP